MRAAVYAQYGPPDVLRLAEVDKPRPRPSEVLIKIRAASVAAADWRMRRPSPMAARLYNGLLRPRRVRILGFELAGDVEAAGDAVKRYRPGDAVFAFAGLGFGCHAEYRCLPETGGAFRGIIAPKPADMSYEEAAAVPCGGMTALGFLRRAETAPGRRVLIYGASGSVGTYAVQLAKHFGAHVTGVTSTGNVDLVRSLGADDVLDYRREDLSRRGPSFDVVFDAVGKLPAAARKTMLARGGRTVSVTGDPGMKADDLSFLKDLIEAGKLRAVIDRRYGLDEIVEAHRYVEAGHKKGNVVLMVG